MDGAETNCGIAHILGILLKNCYEFQILLEAKFIYSLSPSNYLKLLYYFWRTILKDLF